MGIRRSVTWLLLSRRGHRSACTRPSLQIWVWNRGDVSPRYTRDSEPRCCTGRQGPHSCPRDPLGCAGHARKVYHCPLTPSVPPAWGSWPSTFCPPRSVTLALDGAPSKAAPGLSHHLPKSVHTSKAISPRLPLGQEEVWFGPVSVPQATDLPQLLGLGAGSCTMGEPSASGQPDNYLPPVLRCMEHPWCPLCPSIL